MISSDAKIRTLKIEDGKRHPDRDGLVLEIRKSGKKVFLFRFQWERKPQTSFDPNYYNGEKNMTSGLCFCTIKNHYFEFGVTT